ncbi:hypothetical protein B0H11DRAFT_2231870 [Mycena galericulata]|nr:hypothetical protein B0H11DRAFT_2231870 [Mycena galericulata]
MERGADAVVRAGEDVRGRKDAPAAPAEDYHAAGLAGAHPHGHAPGSPLPTVRMGTSTRSLCDANRRALAGQIGAFAEVHARIGGTPDSEKGKVLLCSTANVIQALLPAEGTLVQPVLERLAEALGTAGAVSVFAFRRLGLFCSLLPLLGTDVDVPRRR